MGPHTREHSDGAPEQGWFVTNWPAERVERSLLDPSLESRDPEAPIYSLGFDFSFSLPFLGDLARRIGSVPASRRNEARGRMQSNLDELVEQLPHPVPARVSTALGFDRIRVPWSTVGEGAE